MNIRDSQDSLAWAIFGYLDLHNHGYFRLSHLENLIKQKYIYLWPKFGLILVMPVPVYVL